MNDLARILLGLAGVAANAFGVWAGAHAGMLSVGDGVIPLWRWRYDNRQQSNGRRRYSDAR